MAVTKKSAASDSLKYEFTAVGADSVLVSAATLLTDCAAGPLKTLLTQVNGGLNAGVSGLTWATLPNSVLLTVSVAVSGAPGAATTPTVTFLASPNQLQFATGAAVTMTVELRYRHSLAR